MPRAAGASRGPQVAGCWRATGKLRGAGRSHSQRHQLCGWHPCALAIAADATLGNTAHGSRKRAPARAIRLDCRLSVGCTEEMRDGCPKQACRFALSFGLRVSVRASAKLCLKRALNAPQPLLQLPPPCPFGTQFSWDSPEAPSTFSFAPSGVNPARAIQNASMGKRNTAHYCRLKCPGVKQKTSQADTNCGQ